MEILYIILVLLAVTRTFGELAVRIKQPALVGELVSGIVLGVVVHQFADSFPVLSELTEDPVFKALTDLAVFFLITTAAGLPPFGVGCPAGSSSPSVSQ